MDPRLDSDLLRTFVAIADTGSFTRAADAVHRTQSAVSMQIKKLEETVGRPVFNRGTRGVALTRSGEILLANARRVLRLLDETILTLGDQGAEGEVRIGIPAEYGNTLLPRILAQFSESHSRVRLTVRCEASTASDTREGFAPALERGELDVAVILAESGDPPGEILFHDPLVWITSERHLVHEEDPLPVAAFNPGCWWRRNALDTLERQNRRYRIAYSSTSVTGIQAAVSAGLAVGFLGRSTVPPGARVLTGEEGFPPLPGSNVVMRTRTGPLSPAVERMVMVIREAFHRPDTLAQSLEPAFPRAMVRRFERR